MTEVRGTGFGLEGVAAGMLAATTLNAPTSAAKTHTLIEATTREGELFLLYNGAEPGALKSMLSRALTSIRVIQGEVVNKAMVRGTDGTIPPEQLLRLLDIDRDVLPVPDHICRWVEAESVAADRIADYCNASLPDCGSDISRVDAVLIRASAPTGLSP